MGRKYSKQVNYKYSGLIRIDKELIRLLKIKAAGEKTTIKALVEAQISEIVEVKGDK